MKHLRIACTLIAALFLVAILPIAATLGYVWAGVCAVGALLFYLLMTFFKQKQEENEKPSSPSEPKE